MFIIAGVTGHVGGVAARELLAAKQQVKVIVRDQAKGKEWAARGAEVAVGTLDDREFLTTTLNGAKGFFTLLPPNYAAPDFYAYQRQVSDTIAAAVKASGVPHVVILSSVGADLAEGNGPIKGLHHLENALRATGTKLTSIRASYFQENLASSLAPAKGQGIFPNFADSPDYPMPMIATKDIGKQVANELLKPQPKSDNLDLLGPMYTMRQAAEKMGKALGKDLNIVNIPQAGWVPALVQAGMSQQLAEIMAEMYTGFATGKITPKGDRTVQGTTQLDEVVTAIVG
jgi:uncharacterized protein YbjT (DUF2867 family)